jgi:hypothetical protein
MERICWLLFFFFLNFHERFGWEGSSWMDGYVRGTYVQRDIMTLIYHLKRLIGLLDNSWKLGGKWC